LDEAWKIMEIGETVLASSIKPKRFLRSPSCSRLRPTDMLADSDHRPSCIGEWKLMGLIASVPAVEAIDADGFAFGQRNKNVPQIRGHLTGISKRGG
jgi:hypothetical protein